MKKLFGYFAAFVLAAGMVGCSDDDADISGAVEGAQVYFSRNAATNYTIASDAQSVAVEVLRGATEETIEVPVLATIDSEYASLFNVPDYVVFEAGEAKTAIVITFNRSELADGASYAIGLQIDDESMTTPYGSNALNVTLTVPEPYVLLGTGLFRDDCITTFFDVDTPEYECEIYENTNMPGYIFLKNVYTSLYPYNDPGDYVTEDKYLAVYIEDPDNVLIPKQGLGMDWNPAEYGEFIIGTAQYGTLKNGVITFPEKGLVIGMELYNDGGMYYANTNGMFRICLPGAVLTDYSVEVAYAGRFTDPENKNYAVAGVTGGEDVEYIEVGMGAGDDADAILEAMLAGEIETVKVEGNTGNVPFAVDEDGTYTFVAISYGAGEAQEASAVTFKFWVGTAPELGPLETDWTADDLYGISKDALFGEWYMWARDYFDKEGNTDRQPMNIVTFSENTTNDEEEVDAINVDGLSLGVVDNDTMVWEYYRGLIYNLAHKEAVGTVNGFTIGVLVADMSAGKLYNMSNYMLIGGIVDDGYIAMVSNNQNYNFNGLAFHVYEDAEMTQSAGNVLIYYDIMFEDPAVSALSPVAAAAPKASMSVSQLKSLADKMAVRENYVETDRGMAHRKIDEMLAKRAQLVPASAEATVKTFRGTAKGLREVPAKGNVSKTLVR